MMGGGYRCWGVEGEGMGVESEGSGVEDVVLMIRVGGE